MNAETCFAYNHHWIISGMGYWEELGKNCIRNRRSLGMKEASLRDSPINNCQVNVCTVIIEYSRDSNIHKKKNESIGEYLIFTSKILKLFYIVTTEKFHFFSFENIEAWKQLFQTIYNQKSTYFYKIFKQKIDSPHPKKYFSN